MTSLYAVEWIGAEGAFHCQTIRKEEPKLHHSVVSVSKAVLPYYGCDLYFAAVTEPYLRIRAQLHEVSH